MHYLLSTQFSQLFHNQVLVTGILTISLYSLILNITSKTSKTLVIRDFWILGCAIFNFLGFIAVNQIASTPPQRFITLNIFLFMIIPIIMFLILLDVSQMTGIKSRLFNWVYLFFCIFALVCAATPNFMKHNGLHYSFSGWYWAYTAICSTLAVIPIVILTIKTYKNKTKQKFDILNLLFAIFYSLLVITTIIDSTDYPLAQGKSPRAIVAIFLLALFGVISNAIRYKQITNNMKYYEFFDELTDTIKRKAGMEKLEKKIETAQVTKKPFTLILFDINNFKQLNDYYGYNAGNIYLAHIANQIKRLLTADDLICRTEGDEFLIVTDGKHNMESRLVKNLIHNIDNEWKYENHLLLLKYRMGISYFPDHGTTVSELMKCADESLMEAKKVNAPQVVLYNEKLAEKKQATEQVTKKLKETLSGKSSDNRFLLHYQPKVDRHGNIKSAECLLRWIYEDKLNYPGTFIEIAEKTGLIYEIGDIVLETGLKELAILTQKNPTINIALNLSPQQLNNSKLFESINDKIFRHGIDPALLELEITESTIMDSWNTSEIESFITKIRNAGIKVSIDDFGTGLSSLSVFWKYLLIFLKLIVLL